MSASISTVSAGVKIYLIKQPNPYELDGATSWLSTDLRVFQIKQGQSRFNKTMYSDPSDFITDVIDNLNTGNAGGQKFEDISVDQQTSRLELSQSVGGVPVYNFAIAKIRYKALKVSAQNVRVFFRLFPASSTSLEFAGATTYRRVTAAGAVQPLLGIIGGEVVTIPCFAAPRIDSAAVSMATQTDPANVQTMPANPSGYEVVRYFGCWLDINQVQPQFPLNPVPLDGPYPAATRQTIQQLIRNEHQCLVTEIAFDEAPIPPGASPSTSDKLTKRNLAIVESANPGDLGSHLIPHTFEIKPTRATHDAGTGPDELMIDWGNTPAGCPATVYLPGVDTNEVLRLSSLLYRRQSAFRIDAHTLQCEAGGITYLPIPPAEGPNYAGLISVDLPETVRKGQVFTIVVHQVTGAGRERPDLSHGYDAAGSALRMRRVLGSFQITIPVRGREQILEHEERKLGNLRWIALSIPHDNRWYPVFQRYLRQIEDRLVGLGGDPGRILPSPSDQGERRRLEPVTRRERPCVTGKVSGLIHDRFGDFEGFLLDSTDGEHRFLSREPAVKILAERAWSERLLISVYAEPDRPQRPEKIIVHTPPTPF